ncbi:sigma factor-like helix-turn-helix DNA-binding protein [Streptomyces inhibens]|uniref:sigma factor-like helix-turn-helix DNA-binding protein n=1 Tax=Streptomyces inhibens TaxID=2293571 RepID=UPI00268F5EB7
MGMTPFRGSVRGGDGPAESLIRVQEEGAEQLVGLPYTDAAAVVGCPVGTVRSRVARACADLTEWLRSAETSARVPQMVAA